MAYVSTCFIIGVTDITSKIFRYYNSDVNNEICVYYRYGNEMS